ncbi:MAG: DUF493 family protein [Neisseriaceae bacterium]|nr:DUF493 family protein [Neisseriaceae bacterium]
MMSTEEKTTLLEFPCDFPLKVMGATHPDFADTILAVVKEHAPEVTEAHMVLRDSAKGNYTSATVTVVATSQAQLDTIYLALTGHEMVKVVL